MSSPTVAHYYCPPRRHLQPTTSSLFHTQPKRRSEGPIVVRTIFLGGGRLFDLDGRVSIVYLFSILIGQQRPLNLG